MKDFNLVVFISGTGTNLMEIVKCCNNGVLGNGKVKCNVCKVTLHTLQYILKHSAVHDKKANK